MPPLPVPAELDEFLRKPNPCVIATVRPDGELHTAATWYEWPGDGTVLVNMDASRLRLGHMRRNPRVALTMLDGENWHNHVSLIGRVREIRPDADLADIDRLGRHYTGKAYRSRERDSWTAVIDVMRWHGFRSGVDLTKS
jgi:PPOX class probable F420-dependent enzyme